MPWSQPQTPTYMGGAMQRGGGTNAGNPWGLGPTPNPGGLLPGYQYHPNSNEARLMSQQPQPGAPAMNPTRTGGGTPGISMPTAGPGQMTDPLGRPIAYAGASAPPQNDMLGRMESYFGPLGTPTTALQQQSLGGLSQFLSSNPYGQSNNALQQILGGGMFNEGNQAFRDVGQQNYFGNATNAFGNAQSAFGNIGGQNLFGGAADIFGRLEGFNPFGAAQGALEGQLGVNPGQSVLDALRPQFERNMAAANQEGGRFGSANAILRSRALDDYNLLGAQALQRGVDQQQNAANILGMIGNSLIGARNMAGQGMLGVGQGRLSQGLGAAQGMLGAGQGFLGVGQGQLSQGLGVAQGLSGNAASQMQGQLGAASQLGQNANNMFNAYQGAYQTGSAQAQQEAMRQQQAMALLQNLLGASFGATLGVPSQVNPTGAQTGAQIGGALGSAIPYLWPNGGGGGGMIPTQPASFGIPYNIG